MLEHSYIFIVVIALIVTLSDLCSSALNVLLQKRAVKTVMHYRRYDKVTMLM